jgi:hypothetical protein
MSIDRMTTIPSKRPKQEEIPDRLNTPVPLCHPKDAMNSLNTVAMRCSEKGSQYASLKLTKAYRCDRMPEFTRYPAADAASMMTEYPVRALSVSLIFDGPILRTFLKDLQSSMIMPAASRGRQI